jgi:hypothetical protein
LAQAFARQQQLQHEQDSLAQQWMQLQHQQLLAQQQTEMQLQQQQAQQQQQQPQAQQQAFVTCPWRQHPAPAAAADLPPPPPQTSGAYMVLCSSWPDDFSARILKVL